MTIHASTGKREVEVAEKNKKESKNGQMKNYVKKQGKTIIYMPRREACEGNNISDTLLDLGLIVFRTLSK